MIYLIKVCASKLVPKKIMVPATLKLGIINMRKIKAEMQVWIWVERLSLVVLQVMAAVEYKRPVGRPPMLSDQSNSVGQLLLICVLALKKRRQSTGQSPHTSGKTISYGQPSGWQLEQP